MSENLKVLCVDDDPGILELLEEALEIKYTVLTCDNAEDAIKTLLGDDDIKIIISDHYMEGMNGIDFLTEVKKMKPDCLRFLISGYMDLVDILPKIENGIVTRFIKKPWSVNSLYRILESATK